MAASGASGGSLSLNRRDRGNAKCITSQTVREHCVGYSLLSVLCRRKRQPWEFLDWRSNRAQNGAAATAVAGPPSPGLSDMKITTPRIALFGPYALDLRSGELRKFGTKVKMGEQAFQILLMLLERPREMVTREELRAKLWADDTFVDFDHGLNSAVQRLRDCLSDSAGKPRWVETIPRRGYRFVGQVEWSEEGFSSEIVSKPSGESQGENSDGETQPSVSAEPSQAIAPVSSTSATGTAFGAGPSAPTQRSKITLLVVVASLAVAVSAGLFLRSRQGRRSAEKDTIILADFANTTGDPVFDDALKQGLRVQLEQSPFLNILSDQKASEALQMMRRQKDERLTLELAREVCQRMGSKAVLAGSISKLGAHYAVGLNALNCHTGDSLGSEQVEADSQEHVLKALGESATKMRARLGESLKSIQRFDAPLEQVTTPSLQALRAYSLGMKTLDTKGGTAAIPFLRRVVELDPKFAMAYARLGALYAGTGAPILSAENVRKAYELRERVTERERLYIEAHYYRDVMGEQDKAASVWEVMQQTYPREVEPYSNLAGFYGRLGNCEKALEEAHEALRLDPDDQDSYSTVGYLSMCLNRLDEAQAAFKQAEERH